MRDSSAEVIMTKLWRRAWAELVSSDQIEKSPLLRAICDSSPCSQKVLSARLGVSPFTLLRTISPVPSPQGLRYSDLLRKVEENVVSEMRRQGMSNKECAKAIGCSERTLYRWRLPEPDS